MNTDCPYVPGKYYRDAEGEKLMFIKCRERPFPFLFYNVQKEQLSDECVTTYLEYKEPREFWLVSHPNFPTDVYDSHPGLLSNEYTVIHVKEVL